MTKRVDIGVAEADRKEIAGGLAKLLADTYTLYLRTQNFHWNVVGPEFQQLHKLFERHYRELAKGIDRIAERIRALGFPVVATYFEFSRLSSIEESQSIPMAPEMIQLLLTGNEAVVRTARSIFTSVERANDQSTLNLLADLMLMHEKRAWMLRSFLQEEPVEAQGVKKTAA